VLTGLPYGGRSRDEATRWACLDSSPAIMSGVTTEPLSHEEFNLLFEVRLLRSHVYHEYTRLYSFEIIINLPHTSPPKSQTPTSTSIQFQIYHKPST
jgi:hypothetical protein